VTARTRLASCLAVALAAACVAAPAASAHATLEQTYPERGAVLEQPPDQVALGFDEPVEAAFGAVRVFDASGTQVKTGPLKRPGGDDSQLSVSLPSSLKQGAYTVTYRVVSADGHPVSGGLTFQYGQASAAPAQDVATLLEGTSAGPVSRAANGVARGLGYLAIAVVLGGLAFLALCWRPVVAGERELLPAGEALRDRMARLVAAGVVLGIVAGGAAVVLQAAVAGEMSAWSAIDPSIVREVLGTRTGAMLGVRFVAWCALAVALAALSARPSRVTAAIAVVPAAVIIAGPALAGHATTQSPVGVLAPADIVHVAATSLWIGGLVALLLAVPAATRRLEPPLRTRLLAGVLARFSPLALLSVAALALTGALQAAFHLDWKLAPLADTGFGRSLLVKTALFAALFALGATQRRRIIPALRAHAAGGEPPGGAGVLLRRALRAEVLLVLGVLAATAILVGSPPPRAVAGAAANGPYSADVAIGPQRLQVTIDPARVGPNDMHVYLLDSKTGAPFTGSKELRIDVTLPSKGIGPLHMKVTPGGPGHWIVADAQLAPAGTWRVTVTDRVSDFDEYEARLKVPVR
jgi:copper transport protein